MATKLENTSLETAHFNNLRGYIPALKGLCQNTIDAMRDLGLIQVSTAAEYAVAHKARCKVVSKDNADLSNGDDVKLSSVRTSHGSYRAPVTNIKGKTGYLRVQVFERKTNKFYYFVIPNDAYKHIPATSNIEIPFETNGTPRRRPTRAVKQNWWNYEVDSFNQLATAKPQLEKVQLNEKAERREIKVLKGTLKQMRADYRMFFEERGQPVPRVRTPKLFDV